MIIFSKFLSIKPVRVACVGDSITKVSGYPEFLQNLLGPGYVVGNFGVSGSTVLHGFFSSYIDQPEFQDAKVFLPDIAIFLLGTNDVVSDVYPYIGRFMTDYESLLEEFQTLKSNPAIWIALPPPIFDNAFDPDNTNLVQSIIPAIEQVANKLDLPVIDIYDALVGHPENFFEDGVHPRPNGANIIATIVYNAILQKVKLNL